MNVSSWTRFGTEAGGRRSSEGRRSVAAARGARPAVDNGREAPPVVSPQMNSHGVLARGALHTRQAVRIGRRGPLARRAEAAGVRLIRVVDGGAEVKVQAPNPAAFVRSFELSIGLLAASDALLLRLPSPFGRRSARAPGGGCRLDGSRRVVQRGSRLATG